LLTLAGGKTFPLPVKIQLHCYSSDIVESDYDNQTILSPINVKGEGIKLKKNYIGSKRSTGSSKKMDGI